MTDLDFTLASLVTWTIVIVAYAIRVVRFGRFHSDRLTGLGATGLVGQDIMQATYWAIDPVVRGLVALGVTPDGVTWAALAFGVAAGGAVAAGWFGLACLLATISTIADVLDGQVARVSGGGSDAGELLDAAVDRYTEFAFLAGVVVFARGDAFVTALALAAMIGSFMISYASAKAEALDVATPRGVMRRHERATCLLVGAGVTPLLGPLLHDRWPAVPGAWPLLIALALVGGIGNVAAVQRLVRIRGAVLSPR